MTRIDGFTHCYTMPHGLTVKSLEAVGPLLRIVGVDPAAGDDVGCVVDGYLDADGNFIIVRNLEVINGGKR